MTSPSTSWTDEQPATLGAPRRWLLRAVDRGRPFPGVVGDDDADPRVARVVSLEDDVDLEHALSGRLSTGISRGEFGGVQLLKLVGGEPPDVYPAERWKDVPFDEPLIAGERRGCELDLLGSQRWVRYAPKVRLRLP
jgi:hypothetical protein